MNIHEIRLKNLRKIADKHGGISNLAKITGKNASQISQIAGENPVRKIGENLARKLEIRIGIKNLSLDNDNKEIFTDKIENEITNACLITRIGELILDSNKATMMEKYEYLKEIEKRLKFYKD